MIKIIKFTLFLTVTFFLHSYVASEKFGLSDILKNKQIIETVKNYIIKHKGMRIDSSSNYITIELLDDNEIPLKKKKENIAHILHVRYAHGWDILANYENVVILKETIEGKRIILKKIIVDNDLQKIVMLPDSYLKKHEPSLYKEHKEMLKEARKLLKKDNFVLERDIPSYSGPYFLLLLDKNANIISTSDNIYSL